MQTAFLMQLSAHDQQDQGQDQESGTEPLGAASQLGIQRSGLVLGQEGVGNTAHNTGQASALAGLEQNGHNNDQTANQLQNGNNQFQSTHDGKPPKNSLMYIHDKSFHRKP